VKIKDFSGGLNTFDADINIADNQCATLLNVCYEEGDILRSRYGFTKTRSVTNMRGLYNWYKNDTLHQMYTTTSGLYDNGSRVTASFTGAFHAAEYASMLYLTNGTYMKRYDGTTLYNWGVAAPDAPTVAASAKTDITIDDFTSKVAKYSLYKDWGDTAPTREKCQTDASCYTDEDTSATGTLRIRVPNNSGCAIRRTYTGASALNLRDFGSVAGGDDDYITMRVFVDPGENGDIDDVKTMRLKFWDHSGSPTITVFDSGKFGPGEYFPSKLVNKYEEAALTDQQLQLQWLPSQPESYAKLKIPKIDFDANNTIGDWSDIRKVQWHFSANPSSGYTVYIDDMKVEGGPGDNTGMYGKFRCVAGYYNSTRDEYYGVSEESEEVELDVQGIKITGVPATFDDQADKYIVWARKTGSVNSENVVDAWTNWYKLVEISEGTTSSIIGINNQDLLYEDALTSVAGVYPANVVVNGIAYTRLGSNNLPPPTASNIIMHRGKMFFAVDDKIYHSKPLAPWAVPAGHYILATSTADEVQAFYSDGMDLSVFSKSRDFSYLSAGEYDSQNIYSGTLIEARNFKRGCVSPHSVSDSVFASPQGICFWNGHEGTILTKRIRPTYRAVSTRTDLHGVVWEDLYLLVNPGGNSIVCERYQTGQGTAVRFYLWGFSSTARCCAVDKLTNKLYVGTDTGIYQYDPTQYIDSEGAFTMTARLKEYEYAPENEDAPLERFTVHSNTGGSGVTCNIYVDGVSHGSGTINTTTRRETELFTDLGGTGSYVQPRFSGSVSSGSPLRIYGVEIS
jgi:hypothetical protein